MNKPYVGVWVDHTQAHLIWLDEQGQANVQHVKIETPVVDGRGDRAVSGRAGVYGGVAPHASLDDKQRERSKHLYEQVIKAVSRARSIYIFGPGLAHRELHKRLGQHHKDLAGLVAGTARADKMPENQMVAHVKAFFKLPRPEL